MEIKSFPLFSKWSLKNQNSADWGWGKMRTIPFFWIIGALPVSIFLVFWCSVWFATSWLGLNKWTQLDSFLTMIVFGGHKSIGGWKTNWGKIYVLSITLWLYITFWWDKTTKKQAVWVKALLQKFLKYPSWYSQNIREISVFLWKMCWSSAIQKHCFSACVWKPRTQIVLIAMFAFLLWYRVLNGVQK